MAALPVSAFPSPTKNARGARARLEGHRSPSSRAQSLLFRRYSAPRWRRVSPREIRTAQYRESSTLADNVAKSQLLDTVPSNFFRGRAFARSFCSCRSRIALFYSFVRSSSRARNSSSSSLFFSQPPSEGNLLNRARRLDLLPVPNVFADKFRPSVSSDCTISADNSRLDDT